MSTYNIRHVNSNMDMSYNSDDSYDYYIIDASSNNINITLPSSYWDGLYWQFMRHDNTNNLVTITAPNGATINNLGVINMNAGKYAQIVCQVDNFICPFMDITF